MKRLALLSLFLLVGCEELAVERLPAVFMPVVRKPLVEIYTSPKKGCSLGLASCNALDELGISWYYAGEECASAERIPYLDTPRLLRQAIEQDPPVADYVMFLNECDNPYWNCPPVEEQVALFVALEDAWSAADIIWVGPCFEGSNPMRAREWWAEYVRQTGEKPEPETHRLCVHCYHPALTCIDRVKSFFTAVPELDRIWVTEFGTVPGWDYTYRQARDQNAAFVAWMEGDERVERYAYWSAKFYYGVNAPASPGVGWIPLRFDWQEADKSFTEMSTEMGNWYAGVGE